MAARIVLLAVAAQVAHALRMRMHSPDVWGGAVVDFETAYSGVTGKQYAQQDYYATGSTRPDLHFIRWSMYHDINNIFDTVVRNLAPDNPRAILDVGVYTGGSSIGFAEQLEKHGFSDVPVVSVDDWKEVKIKDQFNANVKDAMDKKMMSAKHIIPYQSKSTNALQHLKQKGMLFNVISIDADHDHVAVYNDLVLAWEILGPGGILMGDDYGCQQGPDNCRYLKTKEAVDQFAQEKGLKVTTFGGQSAHRFWIKKEK